MRNKVAFLKSLRWIDALPTPAREVFVRKAELVRLARHDVLQRTGDPARRFAIVRTGVLRIGIGQATERALIDVVGRGEAVGFGTIDEQGVSSLLVSAHEDAQVYAWPGALVRDACHAHAGFALAIASSLHARCTHREQTLAAHHGRAISARIAWSLGMLARRFGVRDSRGVIINLRLTHRDMALLVGATRESVSVTLGDLRQRELLDVDAKRVIILDPPGLEALANS